MALAVLLPRCGDEFRFDGVLGRPIALNEDASLPLLPVRIDDGPILWALVDIGSPITVMRLDAPDTGHQIDATVALLDTRSVLDDTSADVTRMVFPGASVYDYAWDGASLGTSADVQGVLGADLLGRFSLELRLAPLEHSLTFYDTIAGQDTELSADGWAVFPSTYKGGGRTEAGCAPALPGRRLVVAACVYPEGDGPGVDVSLTVTTRVANLTVGEEAAARLPSAVRRVAIVGDSQDLLGPCEEAEQREARGRGAAALRVDDDFLVDTIADTDAGLVAVRTEVANAAPGIDGFLGAAFLRSVRARLDVPGDRLLLRCEDPVGDAPSCLALPRAR